MTITEQTLIGDIAVDVPSSVRVFQHHGIDFCCGGNRPLGAVCEALGLWVPDVAREIEASTARDDAGERDWARASLQELTEHIITRYHDRLREELPRLASMATRVAQVHGARAPRLLSCIEATVRELDIDLTSHMRKEEDVLFPGLCALDRSGACSESLAEAIRAIESEHDRAGALLADLRTATDGFTSPKWACATTRALYSGLADLESEMHIHVHLENNVLFRRALARCRASDVNEEASDAAAEV
jgi:regulator of cell morphogenesis and NO signaling